MDRNDYIEKVIGGILGGIAIIAAFVEAAMAGFSVDAIVSAVKDIAGTAVVLILLVLWGCCSDNGYSCNSNRSGCC